jgi:hypothetical protein
VVKDAELQGVVFSTPRVGTLFGRSVPKQGFFVLRQGFLPAWWMRGPTPVIQGLFPVKHERFSSVGGITLALLVDNLFNPGIS